MTTPLRGSTELKVSRVIGCPRGIKTGVRGVDPLRRVCYIAGMADRYAIREHRRLFAIEEE